MMSRRFCTCWLLLVTVLLLLLGETYPWHLAVSRGRACWKSSVVGHVAISPQLSSTNRKQHIVNYLPSLRLVHSRHHGDNDISLTRLHDASASSDVLEATPQKPSTQKRPSMKDLLVFGLPTLGIWLLQPILSLIDTAVVGMSKYTSVAELAALGPGISWIDSTSYLFYFMGVATTSLFTTALREQQANPDAQNKPKEVLSNAISISIGFGVILAILQYSLASKSISMLSGSSISSIPYGIRYAQIRALAAPVALFTIVAQAAFLAVKDSMTPLYAVLLGAVVNIIGDVFLVSYCQQGVVGAAIATTCSQYAGALYLAYAAIRKILKSRAPSVSRRQALKHTIVLPKLKESMKFLEFCGPLFFILLTKSFLWTFTTYAASSAGVIDLAAHQVRIPNLLLFTYLFFTPFCFCLWNRL